MAYAEGSTEVRNLLENLYPAVVKADVFVEIRIGTRFRSGNTLVRLAQVDKNKFNFIDLSNGNRWFTSWEASYESGKMVMEEQDFHNAVKMDIYRWKENE